MEKSTLKGSFQFPFLFHGFALKMALSLEVMQVVKTMEIPSWPKEPGRLKGVEKTSRGGEQETGTPPHLSMNTHKSWLNS